MPHDFGTTGHRPGGAYPPSGAPPAGEATYNDPRNPPPFPPGVGRQWVFEPNEYGEWGWLPADDPSQQFGGGGGGRQGPTAEELAVDWAQIASQNRGQDLDLQASMRGYDVQEMLGLKGVEVDWANIGIDKQRLGIDRERTQIERQTLAESIRAAKEREAEDRKQRALEAASNAVDAYLRGSQLADARRLSAFQEKRALLPSLISPNQQYAPGQEPGGPLSEVSQRYGLPFQGFEVQHTQFNPGQLAAPPTQGQIGSDIVGQVEQMRQMGQ